MRVPQLRCLLLREVSEELLRSHIRGLMDLEVEAHLGGRYIGNPVPLARWPNGSFIEGGHMEDATAVKRYLSAEYDIICAEEATQYPPDPLMELLTRARTSNEAMLARGGARCWLPTNPGGPSTHMLRQLFLDHEVDSEEFPNLGADYRREEWVYVPARLEDNPYLDPRYERTLSVLRQKWRFKQLREGDWWAAPGLFFDTFSLSLHVRHLELGDPRRYRWFRSLDWGYHDPSVMYWWVVIGDDRLHIAAEKKWQLTTPEEMTPAIRAIDDELRLPEPRREIKTYASPDMWAQRGMVAEFLEQTARRCGWPVTQARTERHNGWMRLQALLRPDSYGEPRLTIDPGCRYLIRSFQTAQSDPHDLDDIEQRDDHALESCRYGVMSRPHPRTHPLKRMRGEFDEDFNPPQQVRVGSSLYLPR